MLLMAVFTVVNTLQTETKDHDIEAPDEEPGLSLEYMDEEVNVRSLYSSLTAVVRLKVRVTTWFAIAAA